MAQFAQLALKIAVQIVPLTGKTKLVAQVIVASCATFAKLNIVTNKPKTVAQLAQRRPTRACALVGVGKCRAAQDPEGRL